jgi:hypothetical protein
MAASPGDMQHHCELQLQAKSSTVTSERGHLTKGQAQLLVAAVDTSKNKHQLVSFS